MPSNVLSQSCPMLSSVRKASTDGVSCDSAELQLILLSLNIIF